MAPGAIYLPHRPAAHYWPLTSLMEQGKVRVELAVLRGGTLLLIQH